MCLCLCLGSCPLVPSWFRLMLANFTLRSVKRPICFAKSIKRPVQIWCSFIWKDVIFLDWTAVGLILVVLFEKWKILMVTVLSVALMMLFSAWPQRLFFSASAQRRRHPLFWGRMLVGSSWCFKDMFHIFIIFGISWFHLSAWNFFAVFVIDKFALSEILQLFSMFFFFIEIHKLSQFYLKPIHSFITFLYLRQWFFLIGFYKYLNQLIIVIHLFLILSQPIFSQPFNILFHLISQYYSVIFGQLWI